MSILKANWKPDDSGRQPAGRDVRLPRGWKRIGEAFTDGKEFVVCGWPEEGEDHSCDAMGCGSIGPHVIARFKKDGES